MPVLSLRPVHAPDDVVCLKSAQEERVDRVRFCTIAQVRGPDQPEQPVPVPARGSGPGDPLKPGRGRTEGHRDRREARRPSGLGREPVLPTPTWMAAAYQFKPEFLSRSRSRSNSSGRATDPWRRIRWVTPARSRVRGRGQTLARPAGRFAAPWEAAPQKARSRFAGTSAAAIPFSSSV